MNSNLIFKSGENMKILMMRDTLGDNVWKKVEKL